MTHCLVFAMCFGMLVKSDVIGDHAAATEIEVINFFYKSRAVFNVKGELMKN